MSNLQRTEPDSETVSVSEKEVVAERLSYIQKFRLLDDTFMSKCLEDLSVTELVFRIILADYDLKLVSVQTQHEIRNLQGRSIRMDVHAQDINGTEYCLEVERKNSRAIPKRARYNGSLLDANITDPGEGYKKLKKTNVIFITEKDALKGKRPIYHIHRKIEETNTRFDDESSITYVNSSVQDDSPLGRLMHDFHCKNADDMFYKKLADRVRYFKESKEGQLEMCEIMEKLEQKAEERGIRIGEERGRKDGIRIGEEQGRKDGIRIGEERGNQCGQDKINFLNQHLKEDGRINDLLTSISDTVFQQKLLSEYGL